MKAAILNSFGTPLEIATLPDPELAPGDVVVDIVATGVLAYTAEVLSGARSYPMALPMVPGPGGIARIRAVGADATKLKPGDWVFCDPTVRSRDDVVMPDIMLQGWSARGEGGKALQHHWRHGSFAERLRLPTENAIPIGPIEPKDAGRWCAIGKLLVPYGGLLAAGLQAGETLLVNGATGAFGCAGVAVALAMGAGTVLATGRNGAALAELERRFGRRVRTVQMQGDEESDRARILATAPGPIDCVLDLLPPMASAIQVRTGIMAVRPYGRIVLMGGVGMLGGAPLELPYSWLMRNCITLRGQWMCERAAVTGMVGMLRAGLIDLGLWAIAEFALDQANEAVAHAAEKAGPFSMTVLRP